ncbi:MAG: MATE family efflux transporter [Pseudomonadota bacterium]
MNEIAAPQGDLHDQPSPQAKPGKFTQGSTLRHVVIMSAAGAIGLMAIFSVDLLNLFYISMLGSAMLTAAVGYASIALFFLLSSGIGLMISVGALVSRALGARQQKEAERLSTAGMLYSFVIMSVLTLVLLLLAAPLLHALGAQGETYDRAYRFLLIALPSTPLLGLGFAQIAILRSVGDASLSMWVTLATGLFTAVADPLFIFVFDLGIDGAAIVMGLTRIVLVGVGSYGVFYVHKLYARPTMKDFRNYAMPLTKIALPAMLTNVATPFANGYITSALATHGDSAVAAWTIINRIIPFAFGASFSLSGAIGPIIGQNYGAGLFDRLRRAMCESLVLVMAYILGVSVLLYLAQNYVVMVFSATGETAELLRFYCTYIAATFVFIGMLFTANAVFNNLDFPLTSTFFNWSRATLGVIPFVYVFGDAYGAKGVMIGQGIGALVFGFVAVAVSFLLVNRLEKSAALKVPSGGST